MCDLYDQPWVIHNLCHMDYVWVNHGSYGSGIGQPWVTWVTYVLYWSTSGYVCVILWSYMGHMGHVCVIHGSCMDHADNEWVIWVNHWSCMGHI